VTCSLHDKKLKERDAEHFVSIKQIPTSDSDMSLTTRKMRELVPDVPIEIPGNMAH
jgi:hypothetical protein